MTQIFIVMGPPGCGKGTQAALLKEKFSIAHISTGDLFRQEIANNTELGQVAKSYMDKGQYVPDEVTANMLAERISQADCANGFILDGFPRTIPQAEFLQKVLSEKNLAISKIIYYDVTDDVVVQRIKGRAEKAKSAGEKVRGDDLDESIIRNRLETYHAQTKPVLDFYKEKLLTVDASKSVEKIFNKTCESISS
jgi:adenylate kinase